MQSGCACSSPPLRLNALLTHCLTPAAALPQTQLASQVSTAQNEPPWDPEASPQPLAQILCRSGRVEGALAPKGRPGAQAPYRGHRSDQMRPRPIWRLNEFAPPRFTVIQMNLHFLTKTGNICKTTHIKLENKLPLCTEVNTHRKATIAYLKKKRKCSFMFDVWSFWLTLAMAIAIENNDPQMKHRYHNLPDSDGCGVHCELLRQYHFPVSSSFREFQFWQEWHWAQRTKQSSDPTAAKGHCGTRFRARRCTFTRVSGNVPRPDLATYSSSFIFLLCFWNANMILRCSAIMHEGRWSKRVKWARP